MPSRSPKVSPHSALRRPAGRPGGYALSYRRSRSSASFGSSRVRKLFGGSPPHASEYIALCPAAQMQRTMLREASTPESTAGTKSASSTQLAAASHTSGEVLRQCQIFDHHHSDE